MIIYLAFFINILLIIGFFGSIYNKEDKAAAVFGVLFIVSLGGTGYIVFKFFMCILGDIYSCKFNIDLDNLMSFFNFF